MWVLGNSGDYYYFDIEDMKSDERSAFVIKAEATHGTKYLYNQVRYVNCHTHVTIVCPDHGSFQQTPAMHVWGHGCPVCAVVTRTRGVDQVKELCRSVHGDKFQYEIASPVRNSTNRIRIMCKQHGWFDQLLHDHLNGYGCKQCSTKSFSKKAVAWLTHVEQVEGISIQHAGNEGEKFLPDINAFVDGYCRHTNTVYEFDGDAFHGNPSRYADHEKCHPFNKSVTALQLREATYTKHSKIRAAGYNLQVVWESEFDKMGVDWKSVQHVSKNNRIQVSYVDTLKSAGWKLLSEYNGSKIKHQMECTQCGAQTVATPVSKVATYRKRGEIGCKNCL